MESLIQEFWAQPGMGDTLIVLSTVLPTTNEVGASNRISINDQYKSLITRLRNSGRPIVLADMDYLNTGDLDPDGVHPHDNGYLKMAYVWWVAITKANDQSLIKVASPIDGGGSNTCEKTFGRGVYAGAPTQTQTGPGDGIYYHDSQEQGIVFSIVDEFDRGQWFFGRLYGRARDDLLEWFVKGDGNVGYGVWRNTGNPSNM